MLEKYFPKTWKFISNKGSIKNFYKFEFNVEENNLIRSKFVENKIDFFNVDYLTPLSYYKTPFTFYGFNTNNIINDDLKYLNLIEKLKNTLFSVKVKISKENDKFKLDINNSNFRIPLFANRDFFEKLDDFELRFSYYLKLLVEYQFLTYEILYKDSFITAPYWTFITIPLSYFTLNDGHLFRIIFLTLAIGYLVIGIYLLYFYKKSTESLFKKLNYNDKYLAAKSIVGDDYIDFNVRFDKLKKDLSFLKIHLTNPITENYTLFEENIIFDKLQEVTENLDNILSKNINIFLPYLV